MTQETLKELPKIELHCHLDGSLSRPFIEKRLGRTVRPEELSVSENCTSLIFTWYSLHRIISHCTVYADMRRL